MSDVMDLGVFGDAALPSEFDHLSGSSVRALGDKCRVRSIDFEKELTDLINRHSMENGSDTPDYLLAAYLSQCLEIFNAVTMLREKWYGRVSVPSESGDDPQRAATPGRHETE